MEATTINLNDCKHGDILVSKHGMRLTYDKPTEHGSYYDHVVLYPNGAIGTRTNDGHVYRNPIRRIPEDHDIVEIIKV